LSFFDNEYKKELILLKDELEEWTWWLNKALTKLKIYKGECLRYVRVKNKRKEWIYYQPGKIFRFQNMISANIKNSDMDKKYKRKANLIFHIYSIEGKQV